MIYLKEVRFRDICKKISQNEVHTMKSVIRPNKSNRNLIFAVMLFLGIFGGILFISPHDAFYSVQKNKDTLVKDISLNSPHSSESTNVWITLNPINNTHITRGDNITLTGHVLWWDAPTLKNLTNYPIYPVVNNVSYNGLSGNANLSVITDADGNFVINYTIQHNVDFTTNLTIYANLTENPANNIYVGPDTFLSDPIEIDVLASSNISFTTNIVDPVLTNDQYSVLITLIDDNNVPIAAPNVSLYRNSNSSDILQTNITLAANGQAQITVTQEASLVELGVFYPGLNPTVQDGYEFFQISPSNFSLVIPRISSVHAELSVSNAKNSSETGVYTGDDIEIFTKLWINDDTQSPLNGREIEFLLTIGAQSASLGPFTTDQNGEVSQTINLASNGLTNNGTLVVAISVRNGGSTVVPSSAIQNTNEINIAVFDEPDYGGIAVNITIQPPAQNWVKILIPILIGAGLIGGLVLFQRFRMEQSHRRSIKLRKVDLEKFAIMNLLYKVDRRREAIAYSYKIFADLINEKYGLVREKNQTLREFAILCVTKYGLDPLRTYPYIALVENVTYGAYDLTPEEYERAMKVFARIFQEITGTVLNFALEITSETELLEGVTLKIGGD
ncbi:MAG: hypothetical protein DRO88_09625 [Promethearchaeia archaeon]|nr:MAG: hypothetical protein DRO88_09625 [Candidatus Lokiarchaeia archaeon]